MTDRIKSIRLSKAAKEYNVGISTIVEFLHKKGFELDSKPNTKLTTEMYGLIVKEYSSEKHVKEEASKIGLEFNKREEVSIKDTEAPAVEEEPEKAQDELFIKNAQLDYSANPHDKEAKETVEPAAQTEATPVKTPVEPAPAETPKAVTPDPPKEKKETPAPTAPPEKPEVPKAEEKEEPAAPIETAQKKPAKEQATEKKPTDKKPVAKKPTEQKSATTAKTPETPSSDQGIKVLGKIDLDVLPMKKKPATKAKKEEVHGSKSAKEKHAPKSPKVKPAEKADVASNKLKKEPAKKEEPVTKQSKPAATHKRPEEKKPVHQKETAAKPAEKKEESTPSNFLKTEVKKLEGPTILGTIKLPEPKKPDKKKKPVASSSDDSLKAKKKKRKRIKKPVAPGAAANKTAGNGTQKTGGQGHKEGGGARKDRPGNRRLKDRRGSRRDQPKPELTEEQVKKQIQETLAKLTGGGKSKSSKHRKQKRDLVSQQHAEEQKKRLEEEKVIKVTEFVTANELANMMSVSVTDIISICMSLGMFVSINQRLDAETLTLVAEEFGYTVEFVSVEVQEAISGDEDNPEDLTTRHPIVTVMGHVDHGKTSLLDYIRHANVIAGEAGGITQHIGAYEVTLQNGRKITFLDTPGHEAFTAMRARGAGVTDVAIIVIAADDHIMPQTIEAINHAQAAGVPIIFALNKIDRPAANPDKIRDELSQRNILVEEWGGKYQCQEISAKNGLNISDLLEKVLLESDMLELKANPKKKARGTVVESSLDKGRGYIAKLLVQEGTLRIGDIVLAGSVYGRVKAMYNERNQLISEAGPSTPILLLGLHGAPQAGDSFNVMEDERETKQIANKRQQLQREQSVRSQKHITLDEIGRRIAIGDFKELNIIVKGDVDGSVEALSDSLMKLSNEEVQVNVLHKSVGQVTESDVLLASASDAIIVGFQVRPSISARKLAEQEQIDIRLYSVIYQAIDEIKAAIEGMLKPEIEERVVCNIEVREVFKITKVGTVAGCMVLNGLVTRNTKIRLIRDGIVIHTGALGSLKRFKDDVKEVKFGYECGLNIENFNDVKEGDIIEGFEEVEIARKL